MLPKFATQCLWPQAYELRGKGVCHIGCHNQREYTITEITIGIPRMPGSLSDLGDISEIGSMLDVGRS